MKKTTISTIVFLILALWVAPAAYAQDVPAETIVYNGGEFSQTFDVPTDVTIECEAWGAARASSLIDDLDYGPGMCMPGRTLEISISLEVQIFPMKLVNPFEFTGVVEENKAVFFIPAGSPAGMVDFLSTIEGWVTMFIPATSMNRYIPVANAVEIKSTFIPQPTIVRLVWFDEGDTDLLLANQFPSEEVNVFCTTACSVVAIHNRASDDPTVSKWVSHEYHPLATLQNPGVSLVWTQVSEAIVMSDTCRAEALAQELNTQYQDGVVFSMYHDGLGWYPTMIRVNFQSLQEMTQKIETGQFISEAFRDEGMSLIPICQ